MQSTPDPLQPGAVAFVQEVGEESDVLHITGELGADHPVHIVDLLPSEREASATVSLVRLAT